MADGQGPLDGAPGGEEVARLQRHLQRDREDAEVLAYWHWQRDQTLRDAIRDCMSRGDEVEVTVLGGRTFHGEIVHTGGDLACLATRTARVDVNLELPVAVHVVHRAARGGRGRQKAAMSFRVRLEEHEFQHQERPAPQDPLARRHADLLEFGSPLLPRDLKGRIQAVCRDAVYLTDADGAEWYVPLAALAYVASPLRPRR